MSPDADARAQVLLRALVRQVEQVDKVAQGGVEGGGRRRPSTPTVSSSCSNASTSAPQPSSVPRSFSTRSATLAEARSSTVSSR